MNRAEMAVLMKGIAPVMRETIVRAVTPLVSRLVALESREPEKGEQGEKGEDGFGFDDLEVTHDGERSFCLRFVKGGRTKEFPFIIPAMIYRGVFKDGDEYQFGDTVTWAGSLWHCDELTKAKPGEGPWTLAGKRGRDGKDAKPAVS